MKHENGKIKKIVEENWFKKNNFNVCLVWKENGLTMLAHGYSELICSVEMRERLTIIRAIWTKLQSCS